MKLNKIVADKINKALGERNWSSYKLSRKTGLAPITIQGLINCKYEDVKLSSLIVIAHAFDMEIWEFLNDARLSYDGLEFDKF